MREGVPRQTKRGGRYWLFRPLCFEFGWALARFVRFGSTIMLDAERRCSGDSPIRPFAPRGYRDLAIIFHRWIGVRSRAAPPACRAVKRAIAALRLRSEHGSSHAHWARWGTIMRTSLASRASSDGAHPDRADSRIGPRAFLYRTRTHRCSPSPKCVPHIPGLSDLAFTV